jgi:hypothetical protein
LPIKQVFAGVPVADLGPALAWYERLLGRPADSAPNENEAVWHVADGASVYVVADADRAGNALLTLIVDGLEAHLENSPGAAFSRARSRRCLASIGRP